MKTFKFYGASDDLFEMDCDSLDIAADEIAETQCYELVSFGEQGHERVVVSAKYGPADVACWAIGVSPADEDIPIPGWPMRFELSERGYSAQLVVEAPDNTTIKTIGRDE